jgi:glutamate-1-semialdehyde 2,1-aminomutase
MLAGQGRKEMRSYKKSKQLYQQAQRFIAGPHSNLPGYQNVRPTYFEKARGAHIWDVDGNEYIDYVAGLGPGLLGYANEEYIQAIESQLAGVYYLAMGRGVPGEIELAKKIVECVPCADKVRFVVTGTEAVQLAIRLARAYTGRRYFIRFEGHYHGWLDNVLGGVVDEAPRGLPFAAESEDDPFGTDGRAPSAFKESLKLPWSDIEILEETLRKYGEQIALIHMEPILCNGGGCPPKPGYLHRVRELCDEYGIVLCFDEVITGFRVGLGGAQALLGVTPDIATYGKAIAGGIPFAALAGKADIMRLFEDQRVLGAGTFNGYPLGIAAALATLRILERDNGAFYRHVSSIQERLVNGLREIGNEYGIPLLIQGPPGMFCSHFSEKQVAYSVRDLSNSDHERQEEFRERLFDRGVIVLVRGRWYISGAHTDEDVDRTLEAANSVLAE